MYQPTFQEQTDSVKTGKIKQIADRYSELFWLDDEKLVEQALTHYPNYSTNPFDREMMVNDIITAEFENAELNAYRQLLHKFSSM